MSVIINNENCWQPCIWWIFGHICNQYVKTEELHTTFQLKKGLTATRIYYCYKSLKHFTTHGDIQQGSYNATKEGKTVFW